jgi:hypothetical protein
MLKTNTKGDYSFLAATGPFSAAVKALPGFEIVHVRLLPLLPLNNGYPRVEQYLQQVQRPLSTLCGMELRIPKVLSRNGFEQFNRPYIERLRTWGLEVDGVNPVTRTNVVFEATPVREPMLAGFYYVSPSSTAAESFVLSGVPEIASREGGGRVVAPGDTSLEGLQQKLDCILRVLSGYLSEMKLAWERTTTISLYTVYDVYPLFASLLLPVLGSASHAGITWYNARPPVEGLDVEVDARGVGRELVIR